MYTNQTTHYAIPLPLGTDLTTPMDYNEAMQALDTAVWGATQDAATATSDASNAVETANQAATDVGTLGGRVNTLEATVDTQGNAIVGLVNTVTNQGTAIGNKFNSVAVADAYSPTSTYSVGDVVTFEGNRYKCITAVTTGEPFDVDKWQGEDVQTAIDAISTDIDNIETSLSYQSTGWTSASGNPFYTTAEDPNSVLRIRKTGNVVSCHFNLVTRDAITKETAINICNIQSADFNPKYRVIALLGAYSGNVTSAMFKIYINTDGSIVCISDTDITAGNTKYLQGEIVYIVED